MYLNPDCEQKYQFMSLTRLFGGTKSRLSRLYRSQLPPPTELPSASERGSQYWCGGGHVVSKDALSFAKRDDKHPLAQAMFAIPGVRTVFAVNDFVTVTKEDAANWANLTHPIVEALEEVV